MNFKKLMTYLMSIFILCFMTLTSTNATGVNENHLCLVTSNGQTREYDMRSFVYSNEDFSNVDQIHLYMTVLDEVFCNIAYGICRAEQIENYVQNIGSIALSKGIADAQSKIIIVMHPQQRYELSQRTDNIAHYFTYFIRFASISRCRTSLPITLMHSLGLLMIND